MRVGFDIGGTFTDVILFGDDGRITTTKVLSLLDRVGEDIAGLIHKTAQDGTDGADGADGVESFVHGTTIASNAVIEG
jgi:N-methylhydantoinase A/oxoprolinase/acetone carboxylase beta subunit